MRIIYENDEYEDDEYEDDEYEDDEYEDDEYKNYECIDCIYYNECDKYDQANGPCRDFE